MKREFSAGGIVFKTVRSQGSGGSQVLNNKGQVLITQHSSNHYWGFPKGIIDPGQTSKEAAVREVREEGGIEAEIVDKVGDSKYTYVWKEGYKTHNLESPKTGEKIFKIVTIYLMKYLSGDPKDHDWEVSEAKFVEPNEALKTLSFSQDKQHLKKAIEMWNNIK